MKKLICSLLFLTLGFSMQAQESKLVQQVNFNVGKTFSSFLFKDANGNKDENLGYRTGNTYNVGVGLVFGTKHLLRPEIQYSELGGKSSIFDVPIEWKLNYLGIGAAYLYEVISKDKFTLSPGVILAYDYLLKGEQTIGNTRYNLNENDILKVWDMNAGLLLNGRFQVTESFHLSFEYRFNQGLNQIEKQDKGLGEKSRNICHKVVLGLSFSL